MAGGLVALLDDVAALTRLAAASVDDVTAAAGRASAKAAGVIVDDAAVTPRYVQGLAPERELSIIRRIATGSIRNKLVFIVPALLLLSQFLPWVLTPLLMLGGAYLCFEGAEKVWEKIAGHEKSTEPAPAAGASAEREDEVVRGAVRTDFILSAEIMVISLNEIADEGFWARAIILVVVALGITALVYGVVALIVKADDAGLALASRSSALVRWIGTTLVRAMPIVLLVLTVVGVAAMLWVGGHILLVGLDDLGLTLPYDLVHDAEKAVADAVGALTGLVTWLTNTALSAVFGLVVGAVVVLLVHLLPGRRAH